MELKSTSFVLTVFVVMMVALSAVAVAGAQMEGESMEEETMGGDGMSDAIDGEDMDNGSMEDGMDGGTMEDGDRETTTFTVRIENTAPTGVYASDASTGGQVWVTPGAYAVHTGLNPVFTEDESASVGLEAQAEAGPPTGFEGQPGLVDELAGASGVARHGAFTPEDTVADPNDPTGEAPGAPPIAPGGAFEFEVEASHGDHLSFATMFVPSNDLFFAPGADGIALWDGDEPVSGEVTDELTLWDAGTETNGEPGFGDDQAPAQSEPNQGEDEGSVVRPVSEVGDGHEYPDVDDTVQVTVTPHNEGDGNMDDGVDDSMDDGMEDDGMDDSMDDEMDDGMDDGMNDDMEDDSMEGEMNDSMSDDEMDDENMEDNESGESQGGEDLPGFGATAAGLAVLLSAVVMYVRRGSDE